MIKDHVLAFGNTSCVFAARSALAHTYADVPHNSIIGVGKRPAIAKDCDAIARCGLAKNTDALGHHNAFFDLDKTSDPKNDDAIRL